MRYQSPKSVHIKASPQQSTPGLTPELCQLINADVDVRRAASLDNVCHSSDLDTGDQLQVLLVLYHMAVCGLHLTHDCQTHNCACCKQGASSQGHPLVIRPRAVCEFHSRDDRHHHNKHYSLSLF